MPMEREEHENLLAEMLTPDLEVSRKTEILQLLRNDYTTVHSDFNQLDEVNKKFKKDNDDLIVSNSKLFRQTGIVKDKEEDKIVQKDFSETITLESLEK